MEKKVLIVDSKEAAEKSVPSRIVTKHLDSDSKRHVLVHSCEDIRGKGFEHLTKGDIIYLRFYGDEVEPMRFEEMTPWPGATGKGELTPLFQEILPEDVKEDRIIGTLSIVFPK